MRRRHLLPLLAAEFNPNITETLVRTAAILRDEEALLARLAGEAAREILVRPEGLPNTRLLDRQRLREAEPALARRVVEQALVELGCPPRFEYIEAVRRLAESPPGKRVHLRRGLRVHGGKEAILLSYPAGRCRRRGDL